MGSRNPNIKYCFAPSNDEGAFLFVTDEGCYYSVEISQGNHILWGSDILGEYEQTYQLSFDRQCDEIDPGYDEAISNTLVHILGTNIASKGDTCIYFHICDPEEGHGKARAKLYDNWYDDLKKIAPEFEMYDYIVVDPETADEYYFSFFIHANHPNKIQFLLEFDRAINHLD